MPACRGGSARKRSTVFFSRQCSPARDLHRQKFSFSLFSLLRGGGGVKKRKQERKTRSEQHRATNQGGAGKRPALKKGSKMKAAMQNTREQRKRASDSLSVPSPSLLACLPPRARIPSKKKQSGSGGNSAFAIPGPPLLSPSPLNRRTSENDRSWEQHPGRCHGDAIEAKTGKGSRTTPRGRLTAADPAILSVHPSVGRRPTNTKAQKPKYTRFISASACK